jgi:hypothetical protein
MSDPRFELRQVTETEWLILDHKYAAHDARQTVACVYQVDTVEVDVLWMRDLPLSASYMSADDVLQDLLRFHATPDRTTAPIAIPHLAPFVASPRKAEPAV